LGDFKFHRLSPNDCCYLSDDSFCIAIREYFCNEGYSAGLVNSHIINVKRTLSIRSENRNYQYYFEKSMRAIVKDLLLFLKRANVEPYIDLVVVLPSSKKIDNPDYNDKSERLSNLLAKQLKIPTRSDIICIKDSHQASHQGGGRDPLFLYNNFYINPDHHDLAYSAGTIVLVDDVITSGAHFESAKRLLNELNPGNTVIGVFYAKAINRTQTIYEEDLNIF